jgi:hypothetical protein
MLMKIEKIEEKGGMLLLMKIEKIEKLMGIILNMLIINVLLHVV